MEQHEKALELLVYKLGDCTGAEEYCQDAFGEDEFQKRVNRKNLYLTLLKVYLKPPPGYYYYYYKFLFSLIKKSKNECQNWNLCKSNYLSFKQSINRNGYCQGFNL